MWLLSWSFVITGGFFAVVESSVPCENSTVDMQMASLVYDITAVFQDFSSDMVNSCIYPNNSGLPHRNDWIYLQNYSETETALWNLATFDGVNSRAALIAKLKDFCLLVQQKLNKDNISHIYFTTFNETQCNDICGFLNKTRSCPFLNLEIDETCVKKFPKNCGEYLQYKHRIKVVISIQIQHTSTMLSYGAFARHINVKREEFQSNILKHVISESLLWTMFIRVTFDYVGMSRETLGVVKIHFFAMAHKWMKKNPDVNLILESVTLNIDTAIKPYKSIRWIQNAPLLTKWSNKKCKLDNEIAEWGAPPGFLMPYWRWEFLEGTNSSLQELENIVQNNGMLANVYIALEYLHIAVKILNPKVTKTIFKNLTVFETAIELKEVSNFSMFVDYVFRAVYFSDECIDTVLIDPAKGRLCAQPKQIPPLVMYKLTQVFKPDDYNYTYHSERLNAILEHRKSFENNTGFYKEAKFILVLAIEDSNVGLYQDECNVTRINLYCSSEVQFIYEFRESLLMWARIHSFDAIAEHSVDSHYAMGRWYNVYPNSYFNDSILSEFTLLARRNRQETIDDSINRIPFTYPRVELFENMIPNADLTTIAVSGISLSLDLRRKLEIHSNEVQVLLAISLSRFQILEIQHSDHNKLIPEISNALNVHLVRQLDRLIQGPKNYSIFLELEMRQDFVQVIKQITSVAFAPVGIHIKDWDKIEIPIPVKELQALLKSKSLKLGITVEDCVGEINENLKQIKNSHLVSILSYIVCPMQEKLLEDYRKQEELTVRYLDRNLYAQRYFLSKMNVTTYFRPTFESNCLNVADSKSHLQFLNITSQYASGHQVNYFLTNGFANCSWWHVDDYNDLLNPEAYTERSTGQKVVGSLIDFSTNQKKGGTRMGFLASLAVFFVCITGVFIYHNTV